MRQEEIDAGFDRVRMMRFLRDPSTVEFGGPIPFSERLRWVLASLGLSELFRS